MQCEIKSKLECNKICLRKKLTSTAYAEKNIYIVHYKPYADEGHVKRYITDNKNKTINQHTLT